MKRKKNSHVVYIITKLELGGAQKVCLSLFNGMEQTGYSTTLISSSTGKLVDTIIDRKNVILLNSFAREVSLLSVWKEIRCFFQLIKVLRQIKKKYTNVIVHTHSSKAGILGRWAAFFAGIKKRIHTIHGFAFHQHQSFIIWLLCYLPELLTSFITTHYICVSSADVKSGIQLFPRFSHKHSIIRAAVGEQFYIPAKVSRRADKNEPFIFGTISCFKPQKNLFDILRAFKSVYEHNNNARLEIIGDGILRDHITNWIGQHNIKPVVTLHGWQNNVAPIMSTWHTFVLSSLWEGLPCAIVEARLLHLPVISYDTGGIHDIIEHNKNGLLYNQKDWPALATGMQRIMKNKKLYTKLQSYQENLDDFNNTQMIQNHITLYKQMNI